MPKSVIECWLKCKKILIESDLCASVRFFALMVYIFAQKVAVFKQMMAYYLVMNSKRSDGRIWFHRKNAIYFDLLFSTMSRIPFVILFYWLKLSIPRKVETTITLICLRKQKKLWVSGGCNKIINVVVSRKLSVSFILDVLPISLSVACSGSEIRHENKTGGSWGEALHDPLFPYPAFYQSLIPPPL